MAASLTTTTISAAAPVPTPFVAPAAARGAGDQTASDVGSRELVPAGPALGPRSTAASPTAQDPVMHAPDRRGAPPVRRVALRPRAARPAGAGALAPLVPAVPSAPAQEVLPALADAPLSHTNAGATPAPRSSGRPEPTRAATLAAFRNALPAVAAPARVAPLAASAPAITPVLAVARWPAPPPMTRPAPLARVESGSATQEGATSASASAPDLDALADHVLERLRHELRDGRERLGYLLDDLR